MNLDSILQKLDYYFLFAPVNGTEEKQKFFDCIERGKKYNPVFKYKLPAKKEIKSIIKELELFVTEDPIEIKFKDMYLQVAKIVLAWIEDDYQTITNISGQLFGSYKELKIEKAASFYHELKQNTKPIKKFFTAKELGDAILAEFKKIKTKGWKIVYDDQNPSEASIYEDRKIVILKEHHRYDEESFKRIICHEIYGHGFQAFNARLQKKYTKFLLAYLGTEKQYEGIAIFVEINTFPSIFFNAILTRYVTFMMANYYAATGSFYDTYQKIFSLTGDQEFSYMAANRAKRGFKNTEKPGSFQKENSYLFGVYEVIKAVKENSDNFQKLMQGNFPFSVLPLLDSTKTKWSPIEKFNKKRINEFEEKLSRIF